ncbi:hypothetical protein ACN27F_23425 [Solwaraspora sp. WMMB335]|uniref:hypothetical protein n=1 Tax=Solwaraspora sp. WMMB335 TaxID=3404118 RepID=UPI003B963F5E
MPDRIPPRRLAADSWYTQVSLQGRVVQMYDDTDLVDIDRLSRRYLGSPFTVRDRPRVSARIAIDRRHHWDRRWWTIDILSTTEGR